MNKLYFCRHGQSELNEQQLFAGQTDTPLTELGREQARIAGKAATALHIDRIVASPLSRAVETARIIAKAIDYSADDIVVDDVFLEQSYGSLEGQPWSTPDPESFGDIEPDAELRERARQGLELLRSLPDDTVLLVGHGSFGRQLQSLTSGRPAGDEMDNATIIELL